MIVIFTLLALIGIPADIATQQVHNGLSMHVSGSGAPTVVLEAGSGSTHRTWEKVQPAIAPFATVVSYDRAGFGDSAPRSEAATASNSVTQLHAALESAGLKPPYVLVGHSYGGAIGRLFASRYPDEVQAMVLVDPAMEDFYPRAALEAPAAYLAALEEDLEASQGKSSPALEREYLAYETSMQQVRVAKPDKRDKVILLSAARMGVSPELRTIWHDSQSRYAKAVGATLISVDSAHQIPREKPDAVVDAVRSLIAR